MSLYFFDLQLNYLFKKMDILSSFRYTQVVSNLDDFFFIRRTQNIIF